MKKKLCINLSFGVLIILFDQVSKLLLIDKNITVIKNFISFTYTENRGAAFGIGNNTIIIGLTIIILLLLFVYLINNKNVINNYFPFTLIIAGAMGNFIDRVFRGYVIDFIDINLFNFPNFNVADICVVMGIVLLIIYIIRENRA